MQRRALLVGINHYERMPALKGCISDVQAIQDVLAFHGDHEPNFACHTLLGTKPDPDAIPIQEQVTFNRLRAALKDLFACDGTVLFYFSGHGHATRQGVYLVTQDGNRSVPGLALNEILELANASPAREVLLIIDSCFSGALGEPDPGADLANPYVRPGVTLLAASSASERARELDGQGLFTHLVVGALRGGASDIRGHISMASIYAYVEQALGSWDQRPVYKSNTREFSSVRSVTPDIENNELRRLPHFFPTENYQFSLDPTYEITLSGALPEHVAIFKLFKRYQIARLLQPVRDKDLYFAAINSHKVELTALGQFYWQLASRNMLGDASFAPAPRRTSMLDAEGVARHFHETYERLAPYFQYETREATRVPWEEVPDDNKRLMIAVATEILATLFPPDGPVVPDTTYPGQSVE